MKEPTRIEISEAHAEELLERLQQGELDQKDYALLISVVKSWFWLMSVLRDKNASIRALKKLLFGAKTEKTSKLLKRNKPKKKKGKGKKKGHGRNGADAYPGAERLFHPCTCICVGDQCPKCEKGKVYKYDPSEIVCIHGEAPIQATIHEVERLRCNACGASFKGMVPEEANGPKCDASAGSMMALLRYGVGVPHNRLASLQDNMGVPLPSSTQWDVINNDVFPAVQPVGEELIRQAAKAELLHNDDTTARVMELQAGIDDELAKESQKNVRTGIFTSGIIAKLGSQIMALFFTGRKHAGENLAKVLGERPEGLSPPIQMCDALSRNAPKDFVRLLANCMCHGRRNFADIIEDYPKEVEHVLETLGKVYKHDAITKEQSMSDDQRLAYHQKFSKPIMDEFLVWLNEQVEQKLAEPNSRMGKAISYMINHWDALTLFLRVPGAPIDNNVCERALKVAIRHRKNSLFYKTEHGAEVGDLFMTLIHTCRLNDINAFDYLTALQVHAQKVAASPEKWLPWNYQDAVNLCAAT